MSLKNSIAPFSRTFRVLLLAAASALPAGLIGAADNGLMMRASHAVREILVVINSDTIFVDDLDSAIVKFHSNLGEASRRQFDYRKLLNKLVNDRLLIQEAKELGLDKEDEVINRIAEMRREEAVRRYVGDNFKPALEVGADEIRAYYLKNYDKMQIRTIAVKTIEEAENLIAAIRKGASMDSLARVVSLDTYRFRGGLHSLLNQFSIEEPLRLQAEKLKPGELSPPFRYQEVYAFLKLEQFQPADTSGLPLAQNAISDLLKKQKYETAWKAFIQQVETSFPVRIDSTVLAQIRRDSSGLFTREFVNTSERPLLSINDEIQITEADFRRLLSRGAMSANVSYFDSLLNGTLNRARDRLVLNAAAQKANYDNDPRIDSRSRRELDSLLLEMYLNETVVSQITFKRAEFESYYRENPDTFRAPDKFLMDRMTVSDSTSVPTISKRLADGADFEYIAKQFGADVHVIDADQEKGWTTLESYPPEIAADIRSLEIGRISKPYPTSEGQMFFRLKGHRSGEIKPLAEVEMQIRNIMFQKKFDSMLDKVLNTLKANSTIEYREKAIQKYFGTDQK